MKNLYAVTLSAVLVLFSAGSAVNAAARQTAPAAKAAPAKTPAKKAATKSDAAASDAKPVAWPTKAEDMSGKLQEVNTRDSTFTLLANGTVYSFHYTKATKIQVDGKASGINALIFQAGHNATVHYMARKTGNSAEAVEAGS